MERPEHFQTLIIANPQAANGALGRRWPRLAQLLQEQLGPCTCCLTSRPGEASELARHALEHEGYEMIVAMGGDGTVGQVLDGFFTGEGAVCRDAVLGVLPFGRGRDFCRGLGISSRLVTSVRGLRGRQTRRIDVGRLTYCDHQGRSQVRHFINVASFGMGGLVDQLVNSRRTRWGGKLSFAFAAWQAMRRYEPQRARLRLDERAAEEMTLQNVAIANGQYFGGGMHIAPAASLEDGLFDVIILGPLTKLDFLRKVHRVYRGTHLELPQVRMERARRVEATLLDPQAEILLDVDGEALGRLPATFEVLPAALNLKCS